MLWSSKKLADLALSAPLIPEKTNMEEKVIKDVKGKYMSENF